MLGQGTQIVVVQLHRPARMGAVLRAQHLADGHSHLLDAGIGAYFAPQDRHRIAPLAARPQQPALDGRSRKAHRLTADRMLPGACCQLLYLGAQLALGRRRRQQLPDHREAQMRPAFVCRCVCRCAHAVRLRLQARSAHHKTAVSVSPCASCAGLRLASGSVHRGASGRDRCDKAQQ